MLTLTGLLRWGSIGHKTSDLVSPCAAGELGMLAWTDLSVFSLQVIIEDLWVNPLDYYQVECSTRAEDAGLAR